MWSALDRWEAAGTVPVPSVVALVGAGVLAASSSLTWASANVGDGSISYTLLEIPFAPAILGAMVAAIVLGAVAGLMGRPAGLRLAGLTAVLAAAGAVGFLLLAEWIVSIVLGVGIPVTPDRLLPGAGVGPGPWLALVAALAIAACALEPARERAAALGSSLWSRGPISILAPALLTLLLVALVWLREEPWLSADAFGTHLSVSGVALPWVALFTYATLWVLVAGIACLCAGRLLAGALVTAVAGWSTTFFAALAIAGPEALSRTPVRVAHATSAAWLSFALGCGIAAVALALLRWGGP